MGRTEAVGFMSRQPPAPPAQPELTGPQPEIADTAKAKTAEIGGPKGLEPTRYGDWERNGRCTDF